MLEGGEVDGSREVEAVGGWLSALEGCRGGRVQGVEGWRQEGLKGGDWVEVKWQEGGASRGKRGGGVVGRAVPSFRQSTDPTPPSAAGGAAFSVAPSALELSTRVPSALLPAALPPPEARRSPADVPPPLPPPKPRRS